MNKPVLFVCRETLWNEMEYVEKNNKAQLAYSFDIALVWLHSSVMSHTISSSAISKFSDFISLSHQLIAQVIQAAVSSRDLFCRVGGEEHFVLLPADFYNCASFIHALPP